MKKFLTLAVVALLLGAVTGCSSYRYEGPRENTTTRSVAREVEAPLVEQLPTRSVLSAPRPESAPRRHVPFRRGSRRNVNLQNTTQEILPAQQNNQQIVQQTVESVASNHTVPLELASHVTEYDANDKNRAHNIALAAKNIDGHVVKPGETFSFNEVNGPTGRNRGYKKSTIFIDGEKHKNYGGGVCQVSTTLFNAAERAGMTILERHDHSLPVGYAAKGKDAATSYGGLDFKFKNDKPHPIVINSTTDNGTVTVKISGA